MMTAPSKEVLIARYGEPDDLAEGWDTNNLDRAEWAWLAVEPFMQATGQNYDRADFEDPATGIAIEVIGDLIADLMHLATLFGEDAEAVLGSGERHFTAEVGMGYEET